MGLTVVKGEFCKSYNLKFSMKDSALLEREANRRGIPVGRMLAEWLESDIEFLRMTPPSQEEYAALENTKTKQKQLEAQKKTVKMNAGRTCKDVKFQRQPRSDS